MARRQRRGLCRRKDYANQPLAQRHEYASPVTGRTRDCIYFSSRRVPADFCDVNFRGTTARIPGGFGRLESPDGKSFYYGDAVKMAMMQASTSGGTAQPALPLSQMGHSPQAVHFYPDGKAILMLLGTDSPGQFQLARFDVATHEFTKMETLTGEATSVTWGDGAKTILLH